ncbi:MAG: type II toxin-antitoxin system CcdA family antitoxin [Acidiphilium sp.]
MGYDRNARKRPINLSMNENLVHQARSYTKNLSATLETLLGEFVDREARRRHDEDAAIDRVIDDLNAFHHRHGLLSDEFSAL